MVPEVALGWPDHFNDGAPSISYLSIGYTFLRDRRDARIFTTAGSYAELKVDRFRLGLLDEHAPENTIDLWHGEEMVAPRRAVDGLPGSARAHHAGPAATLLHPGRVGLLALCTRLTSIT